MSIPGTAGMVGHIKAGKLRALAVTGATRSPQLPDVPTVMESGVPGYEAYVWMGLLAPKGTPPPIVDELYRECWPCSRSDDVKTLHGDRRHRDRRFDAGGVRHASSAHEKRSVGEGHPRHRREDRLKDATR